MKTDMDQRAHKRDSKDTEPKYQQSGKQFGNSSRGARQWKTRRSTTQSKKEIQPL
jgi:hypothetical protein